MILYSNLIIRESCLLNRWISLLLLNLDWEVWLLLFEPIFGLLNYYLWLLWKVPSICWLKPISNINVYPLFIMINSMPPLPYQRPKAQKTIINLIIWIFAHIFIFAAIPIFFHSPSLLDTITIVFWNRF